MGLKNPTSFILLIATKWKVFKLLENRKTSAPTNRNKIYLKHFQATIIPCSVYLVLGTLVEERQLFSYGYFVACCDTTLVQRSFLREIQTHFSQEKKHLKPLQKKIRQVFIWADPPVTIPIIESPVPVPLPYTWASSYTGRITTGHRSLGMSKSMISLSRRYFYAGFLYRMFKYLEALGLMFVRFRAQFF